MKSKAKELADALFPVDTATDELEILDIPPEKRRLHTETYDFSTSTIVDYLKDGRMFVPSFQRKYVWTRTQASKLIESLIIQCPIPVIYLNQERDERFAIIDGNQRVQSILQYLTDRFHLQNLQTYPELEGLSFSQLDPRIQRHIRNRTLRCIAILKDTHPQIKFDVFERLNTGAVQLNQQEIRHGMYHGKFMNLIDELEKEKVWKSVSSLKSDIRMKGAELILRFFALYEKQSEYKKPLKTFLNSYCESKARISEFELLSLKNLFLSTISIVHTLFGSSAFYMLDMNGTPVTTNINSALFDAVMVGVARSNLSDNAVAKVDKSEFLGKYCELINSETFRATIETGTSATSLVNSRINLFGNFLNRIAK
jgi:hypothetical protein